MSIIVRHVKEDIEDLKLSIKEEHKDDLTRILQYKNYYASFRHEHNQRPSKFDVNGVKRTVTNVNETEFETLHMLNNQKAVIYLNGCAYINHLTDGGLSSAMDFSRKVHAGVCICVNCRVAPEYSYLEMLTDTVTAYKYLLQNGYQAKNIIVAGDSSGGGTALATVLKIRDLQIPVPGKVVLFSPWANIAMDSESYKKNKDKDCMLGHNGLLEYASKVYSVGEPKSNPYVYPCFASLHDMPDILIEVGTDEIVFDDSMRIEENGRKAGTNVIVNVYEGLFHEFQNYDTKASLSAWEDIINFIN